MDALQRMEAATRGLVNPPGVEGGQSLDDHGSVGFELWLFNLKSIKLRCGQTMSRGPHVAG